MTIDHPQKTGTASSKSNEQQNQLKFEFSTMEPITPKKPIEDKPSFLDKAKGFLPKREHKEERMNPNNPQQPDPNETEAITNTTTVKAAQPQEQNATVSAEPLSNRFKQPETWEILNKLPAKHRRLFIALFVLILLLLIFFWLKPNATTVDALQAQNTNVLPIEFQSLHPSEEDVINQATEANNHLLNDTANQHVPSPNDAPADNTLVQAPTQQPAIIDPPHHETPKLAAAQPTQPAPEAPKTQSKPITRAKAPAQESSTAKTRKAAPVETAKPTSHSSHTLIIPQGVSLMQVFRNNNLNISDVNAMAQAKGGEVLSNFKPGDKVTIQLNAHNHVSRLTLQNGSSFTRNSNGSYQYKKK